MDAQISDFEKISNEIYQNRAEHEAKIKELFVKTEICTIDEFYNSYQQEIRDINSEVTPSKNRPTVAHFKEIFHAFDKYPSNLQKPKKSTPRELNRTLANSRAVSATEVNAVCVNNSIATSPQPTMWENGATASDIYSGFKKFRQSLNKLSHELKQKELDSSYMTKLQKLNSFAKDIEKLCGTEFSGTKEAFTEEEAMALCDFAVNLEKALYIDINRNLFQEEDQLNQQLNSQNLECVLELLAYWLNSIGHYVEI